MSDINKPLIVFGVGTLSSVAVHCLAHDTNRATAAFAVDATHLKSSTHEGLPVIAFDKLTDHFPPDTHDLLLPLGWTHMNEFRRTRCEQAKTMGYALASYVSSRACVWPDTPIGENVLVFEQAVLQSYVRLGENVIVRSGANIGHHSRVGNHCFIASGVVTGGKVTINDHCFIGLGATLRDNITIAERCFIGAGAVVISDTEPDGIYVGNPARRLPNKTSLDVT